MIIDFIAYLLSFDAVQVFLLLFVAFKLFPYFAAPAAPAVTEVELEKIHAPSKDPMGAYAEPLDSPKMLDRMAYTTTVNGTPSNEITPSEVFSGYK